MTLLEALAERLKQARELRIEGIDLLKACQSGSPQVVSHARDALHNLGKDLSELVIADERFAGRAVQMIRSVGGMAFGFFPIAVGAPLVHAALQKGSAEAAIEWLQQVLSNSSATGSFIHLLWGVKVNREFQLTDNVTLAPVEKLPDSPQRKRLLNENLVSTIHTVLDWTRPEAALVTKLKIDPLFIDGSQSLAAANNEWARTKQELDDITLVLSLTGPCMPMLAMQWFNLDEPDLELASFMSTGTMRIGKAIEILPGHPMESRLIDGTEATELVRAFFAMNDTPKQKLRIALGRFIQAQLRHDVGDRAVELATALETLLGDNETNEMTHKITIRLVRLLGGTDTERKKNFSVTKKMYGFRSKLLHVGSVDTSRTERINGAGMTSMDIVDHAATACVELMKLIIRRGSIPDWSHFDITEHPTATDTPS
jgi:hypothetical protein